jgi:hypothetical protein
MIALTFLAVTVSTLSVQFACYWEFKKAMPVAKAQRPTAKSNELVYAA